MKNQQKEEVKTATEMMVNDMQEEEYYRIKHTPSDTFIEEKMKELKELLKCGDKNCQEGHYPLGYNEETDEVEWGGCPNCVTIDGYFPRVDPYKLENLLKSSLQEQREIIEKEIETKIRVARSEGYLSCCKENGIEPKLGKGN